MPQRGERVGGGNRAKRKRWQFGRVAAESGSPQASLDFTPVPGKKSPYKAFFKAQYG